MMGPTAKNKNVFIGFQEDFSELDLNNFTWRLRTGASVQHGMLSLDASSGAAQSPSHLHIRLDPQLVHKAFFGADPKSLSSVITQ